MPDSRSHRGPHPDDARLFGAESLPPLRAAAHDFCWLLNRGYAPTATLELVGNRRQLDKRQRMAIARFACTDAARHSRRARQLPPAELRGRVLAIDGFNVLTTLEAALAGAVVLAGRDGTFRDLAGMHGTYRKVEETLPALQAIGQSLSEWGMAECCWYLDRPVSNSGRLQAAMLEMATAHNWPWRVELENDPDAVLKRLREPIVSADSAILDECGPWLNLARHVVERHVPGAWIVDLNDA